MKTEKNDTRIKAQRGFTTLELSIVIIIFGTVMATFLYALQSYYKYEKRQETKSSLSSTELAIVSFRNTYGRYPCPARAELPITDPMAGRESCNQGRFALGARDTLADVDTSNDLIIIGAVPYKTLMDPDNNPATDDGVQYSLDAAFDGWNNKLTYAVTRFMTSAATYKPDIGAIAVNDEFGKNLLQLEGSAPFVILSHGMDGLGSYNRSGAKVSECTNTVASDPGAGGESETGEEKEDKYAGDPKRADLAKKADTTYIPDMTDAYGRLESPDDRINAVYDYMMGRVAPIMEMPEHSAFLSGTILAGLIENGVLSPEEAAAVSDKLSAEGAYTPEENEDLIASLPAPTDGTSGDGKDDEPPVQSAGNMTPQIDNCNTDGSFTVSLYSENASTYFDDTVKFGHPAAIQHWRPLSETKMVNANIGNVGINEVSPQQKLHVSGTASAISVEIEEICDSSGQNCFSPALLSGRFSNSSNEMGSCGPGKAVRGIAGGKVVCATVDWPIGGSPCPTGTYMTGISNTTGPICALGG